jgi:O-antigen ligase
MSILLLVLAIAWSVAVWRNPQRTISLLPLLLPTYVIRTHLGPLPTTALELVILATAIGWFTRRGFTGVKDVFHQAQPWLFPLGLWIIAGVISVVVSPVKLQALGLFRAYFIEPILILFVALDVIRTHEHRERLWRAFGEITIVVALWAIVQYLTHWGIPSPWNKPPEGIRATGPFPFPNALALFVTPIAALAMTHVVSTLDRWKASREMRITTQDRAPLLFNLSVTIAGIVAILCAKSDGGFVALAAATLIAFLMHTHSRRFAFEIAAVGLIAIVVIPALRNYVTQVILLNDWSGNVRKVMWHETVMMLKDHPIFGAGLAGFPATIAAYHKATWMEIFQYPHNIILNLWSETGLLGIAAFAWILWTWIKQAGARRLWLILPVVAAILVHGLVDVPYFKNDLAVTFWLLILLTTYETQTDAH